jgi:hypothetical protein
MQNGRTSFLRCQSADGSAEPDDISEGKPTLYDGDEAQA